MSDRIYWTQEQEKWFLAAHSRSSPNYIYQKCAGNLIRWQEKWKGGDPRGEKRQFRFTDHLPHDESGNPSLFFLAAFMFLSTTENKTKWCKEGRRERKFGMQIHPRLPCHPMLKTLWHNKHNIFSFRLMIHEVSISFKSKAMQFFPFKPDFCDSYVFGHPHVWVNVSYIPQFLVTCFAQYDTIETWGPLKCLSA